MGMVQAEITLKNVVDEANARNGLIGEDGVRSITVTSIVDTGASTLVINEELREKLGLAKRKSKFAKLADGRRVPCWWTDPVDILWKNRSCACEALVIAEADKVLLGALPLESMDLIVHPKTQELVGAHGDEEVCYA